MRKRYAAACPISYRPTNDCEQHRKNILGYIFSGYETCDSAELHDVCLQTDLNMADWDDQYFENVIDKLIIKTDIGDSRPVEEYADAIESGDEEFHSVKDDETHLDTLHSINIQLKDSPQIILEDGVHKTKISLSPNYLEKNGLELIIGEGPARNIRLKAGDAEIYPSDKALPSGINISVTDENFSEKKDEEINRSNEGGEKIKGDGKEIKGKKLGLLSLVVDDLDQQNIEQFFEEKIISSKAGGNIVQCISDYNYLKEHDKREVGIFEENVNKMKIHRANAALELKKEEDPEVIKRQKKEMYKKAKKKFFKSVLEGDPRMDVVKQQLIEDLVKRGYESPSKEKFTSTEIQTEVHIDPAANDDYSFSDDSDSILRRFNALRNFSNLSTSVYEPSLTKDNKEEMNQNANEKTDDKNNTHEYTIGQIDTDFSTRTEPTMEGISDLTERNVLEIIKLDATDDDVSDISTKPKKTPSVTSIEKRSKQIDTQELEDEEIRDLAVVSDRLLKSPSLLKALRSFDEELSPLKQELSRLLSDFKSIDIPEEVQISVAAERLPERQPTPVDRPSTSAQFPSNTEESIHHFYRNSSLQPREDTCHCSPGTCLGLGRSSGIICQRVRRLPPTASSSQFFREFTRPSWVSGSFRPHSILSDPEDIYGDRVQRLPSSASMNRDDLYNKPGSK